MRDSIAILVIAAIVASASVSSLISAQYQRQYDLRQALGRGFAERCVGTSTIYWKGECPPVPSDEAAR